MIKKILLCGFVVLLFCALFDVDLRDHNAELKSDAMVCSSPVYLAQLLDDRFAPKTSAAMNQRMRDFIRNDYCTIISGGTGIDVDPNNFDTKGNLKIYSFKYKKNYYYAAESQIHFK